MFKFKSTIVTPTTVIFVGMLVAIMFMIAAKPAQAPLTPVDYYTVDEVVEIQNDVMREYQLEILRNGKVAVYDGNRLVDVLPMDNHCNLTNLLLEDNR